MPQIKRLHHEVERSSAYFIAGFRTLYLFCLLPLSTTYELCPRNATAQSDNLTPHLRVWTHALEIQVKWTVTNHSLIGGMGIDCMVPADVLVRQVRKVNARDQEF